MDITARIHQSRVDSVERAERNAHRLVPVVWTLLIVNTLGSLPVDTIVPIPRTIMQLITMGAVGVAFALALLINPRLQIRPSAYLLLLTLLLLVSITGSSRLEAGYGSLIRIARLTLFIGTLWLLSRWWNDTLTLVRHHVRILGVVLASVAVGLVIAPGLAMPEEDSGRLVGVIWPLTAPQVGQYAAIVAGLAVLLWLSKLADGRSAAFLAIPSVILLLLTHTRTAMLGLIAGLAVALTTLAFTNARARRALSWAIMCAGAIAVTLGPVIVVWLRRGQDEQDFATLTGRANVWDSLLAAPRTWFEQTFGVGLSNKSFNGLPIDNSWLAAYQEQGLAGVTIVGLFLLILIVVAVSRPPSPARACAIFLIVYCIAASYTEAGLADASPSLLYLTLAAGLLSSGNADSSQVSDPQRMTI